MLVVDRRAATVLVFLSLLACDTNDKKAVAASASAAPPPPSAAAVATESAPGGCNATAGKPVELAANIVGFIYGFAGEATSLYYASWDLYGNRGNLGKVRKDGERASTLASIELEPRGLVVDADSIFYSSGIRLMKLAKSGGDASIVAPKFSSQAIAIDATNVYGVPGDYGPYDRLIRMNKKSSETYELAVAERPESKQAPFGYTSMAVDASGIYVTDSSGNRLLRFGFERRAPKTLATKQEKPYDVVLDANNVYFNLARAGHLMKVAKTGGAVTKLATGLVQEARMAVDDSGVFTTLAGENDQAPSKLSRISLDGKASTLTSVPASHSVEAIAIDSACVYWVQRDTDAKKAAVYALRR
jgi:hypothetical protein